MNKITIRFQKAYPMVRWEGYSETIMSSIKTKLIEKENPILPTPKVGMYLSLQSFADFPLYNFTNEELNLFKEICKRNFRISTITLHKTHLELLII